jgi:F0F1-type ATP synthase assembly protein I
VNNYEPLKKGLQFTHLGLTMVVIVAMFGAGGYYLDGYFNTGQLLTVIGIFVGAVAGMGYFILEIYRLVTEGLNEDDASDSSARS